MNKQLINNRIKTSLVWLCGLLAPLPWGGVGGGLLSSCADWTDHYEGEGTVIGGSQTLWEQLQANPQLSDFCEVLRETKVYRMHKKTTVSYADLLDGGQSFTIVAPVNGSFDKAALLQQVQTPQGDSVVEKSFVQNHLMRSLNSLQTQSYSARLLNSKRLTFDANQIEGINVVNANVHAKNGVLHVVEKPMPYLRNIFENFCDMEEFSTIGQNLRYFEEDYFDADASVSSGIIEGVPIYVDSVIVERNRILERIGYLNAEDSTYWVVTPSAEGWQRAYEEAKSHFLYDAKVLRSDSLQRLYATRALLDDAIYNMTLQKSPEDSLVSVQYDRHHPEWHCFYKPFQPGGILSEATPLKCSNGTIYQTAEWPFTPEQTYFKELWSEAESTWLITDEKDCTYDARRIEADSISEGGYLRIAPKSSTSRWELGFRVNNTLSGNYDVCAIIAPSSVYSTTGVKFANKFKATINYVDEKGNKKSYDCGGDNFFNDPLRVDTVVLAENFYLPACNYGLDDIKVTVNLKCTMTSSDNQRYSRTMYLDCIYLRPRSSKPE